MKENIVKILKLDETELEIFRDSINALFTGNFLVRGLEEHRKYYSFIVNNREAVDAFLDCAGWTLKIDETLGVMSWQGPASVRQNILLDETLALLIMRLMYEEKKHEISLLEHPTATQEEFQEKFRTMCERQLKKTRVRDILKKLQGFRLIKVHGEEIDPDARIEMLPSIVYALDGMSIDEIYDRLKALEGEEPRDEERDNADLEEDE